MQTPTGKRLWAQPGRSPWLGVVDAAVGCVLAGMLVTVAAVFSAPDLVAELFAAVAVVIVIATTGQLPAAIRSLRRAKHAFAELVVVRGVIVGRYSDQGGWDGWR